jgi:ABC-type transport system substrate-binding protein
LKGRGRPADGPIWPEHWALAPGRPTFNFDPGAARRRLDASGFKQNPDAAPGAPSRFSFNCAVFAEDPRFERIAVLVQKQLADVGIDMKLVPLKGMELSRRLASGEFDSALFEAFGRSVSWAYDIWHSHGVRVDGGYSAADTVLDRIRGARSDDELKAQVAELSRVLHDDPPAAFIAWQDASRAVSATFDVAAEPKRDIMANVWQWRPATAAAKARR